MAGAGGVRPGGQGIVDLIAGGVGANLQELGEVAVAHGNGGHGVVDFAGTGGLLVFEAGVAEEEEEFVAAIEYFRNQDGATDGAVIVVGMAGGEHGGVGEGVCSSVVPGSAESGNLRPAGLFDEERGGVPTLIDVLVCR